MCNICKQTWNVIILNKLFLNPKSGVADSKCWHLIGNQEDICLVTPGRPQTFVIRRKHAVQPQVLLPVFAPALPELLWLPTVWRCPYIEPGYRDCFLDLRLFNSPDLRRLVLCYCCQAWTLETVLGGNTALPRWWTARSIDADAKR